MKQETELLNIMEGRTDVGIVAEVVPARVPTIENFIKENPDLSPSQVEGLRHFANVAKEKGISELDIITNVVNYLKKGKVA